VQVQGKKGVGVSRESTNDAGPKPKKRVRVRLRVKLTTLGAAGRLALAAALATLGCDDIRLCADNLCELSGGDAGKGGGGRSDKLSESTTEGEPWETSSGSVGAPSGAHGGETGDGTDGSVAPSEPCDPESERGCEGETPWCLGEGERSLDGGWSAEPRCVECEEDSHCGFPYREQGTEGLCYNYECVACEPGSNRGCAGQLPYCVERVWAAPLGVDASAGAGETLSAGGSTGDSSDVGGSSGAQASVFECGECLEEAHCGDGAPACVGARCVECSRDEHCGSPQASKCDLATHTCVGCTDVGQCAHVAGAPACDRRENRCVECTREESDACGGRVCNVIGADPGYQTCSGYREASTTQCGECVNDAQCRAGYRCVEETYKESGSDAGEITTGKRYCMALERELGANKKCGNNRPFVGAFAAVSENGVEGPYCRLRYATCSAYLAYGNGPDTVPAGEPAEGEATCFGHESCGLPGVADGYCVEFTPLTNRCTCECVSDDDCKDGVSCDSNAPPDGVRPGRGVCKVTTN
jgi:hypothetical protein